jgi:hypothetical protein
MELMGYQPSKKKCGVSGHCIKIMTRKGLTGYGITHQLLWTMLSDLKQLSPRPVLTTSYKTIIPTDLF